MKTQEQIEAKLIWCYLAYRKTGNRHWLSAMQWMLYALDVQLVNEKGEWDTKNEKKKFLFIPYTKEEHPCNFTVRKTEEYLISRDFILEEIHKIKIEV